MCCSAASWKREEVPDHKFDFINVHEFHTNNCATRLQYCWLYLLVFKSAAVYVADIYTGIALLASNYWSGTILQSEATQSAGVKTAAVIEVPFKIGKWIFFGCIIFSFVLLAWEARKARKIIASRDISYAFTNVMSFNWYTLRSYDHFCFFSQIDNSKKKKDEFAFFVFFTFKGWKRLMLADAPRQVINGITLFSFGQSQKWTTDWSKYYGGSILKLIIIFTMLFTVAMWIASFVLLSIAAFMYIPLLCYIQGNLKEYCCHKVDKRIAELMKRKNRKRFAKEADIARREARGDFRHLKDKAGNYTTAPLPQPTLPKLGDALLDEGNTGVGNQQNEKYGNGQDYGSGVGYPPASSGRPPQWSSNAKNERPGFGSSPMPRNGFPFARSDSGLASFSQSGHGHELRRENSESSLDGFATRGNQMGYGTPLNGSQASLLDYHNQPSFTGAHGGPGNLSVSSLALGASGLSRVPSYTSRYDDDKSLYLDEDRSGRNEERSGGGGDHRDLHSGPYNNGGGVPAVPSVPQQYQEPSYYQLPNPYSSQQQQQLPYQSSRNLYQGRNYAPQQSSGPQTSRVLQKLTGNTLPPSANGGTTQQKSLHQGAQSNHHQQQQQQRGQPPYHQEGVKTIPSHPKGAASASSSVILAYMEPVMSRPTADGGLFGDRLGGGGWEQIGQSYNKTPSNSDHEKPIR